MTVASITYNFDQMLTTTLMNYRKKLYDNVFNACPFFYWLHANGRKRIEDGGERIVIPLQYGRNTTIKSMTSGYSIIDTTPQDNITAAYYEWKEVSGSISISNKELVKNSGKHKVIDLLQAKTNEAEMSMTEELEGMVIGKITGGQAAADFLSIWEFLQKTPSGVDTVGGIAQGTYAWWRNQVLSAGYTTWAAMLAAMASMYNSCSKGGAQGKRAHPDMILTDQNAYESYESACVEKTRLYNEKVGDLGYGGLKYKGCTMMWDEYMPDVYTDTTSVTPATVDTYTYTKHNMAFINSDFIDFVIARGQDLTVGPFIQPENQKAKTSIIYIMGEVCCSNRRKQGLLMNITASLAA
uniref:Putative capsid protein n=1 Tax=viral metagenome TaxID=1070528 RepID=A0A6M3L231_9ZZZZ